MKNIVLTICLTLMMSAFLYSNNAEAYSRRSSNNPFYIEPYAGYFIGKVDSGNDLPNGDIKSLYYGARVGIETSKGFIIGVDYGQGTGDFDPDSSSNIEGDYVQKDLGAFIGYRVSPHIRLYGSYIFKSEAEFERGNNLGDLDIEGDGYNAGIDIKAHTNLKIGLEYQVRNLKEYSNGTKLPGSDSTTAYLLTLKLPVPMPFNIR